MLMSTRNIKIAIVAVFISILSSGVALAQDSNPVFNNFVIPYGPTAPLARGCQIELDVSEANNLYADSGPWGKIIMNFEETRFEVSLRHAISTPLDDVVKLEAGGTVPLHAIWGGFLDGFLDAYHTILGVNKNPVGQQFRVRLETQFGGSAKKLLDHDVYGFGDPLLWLGASRDQLFGKLVVKLPLGNAQDFLGAGFVIVGGTVGWTERTWGVTGVFSVPLSDKSVLEGVTILPSAGVVVWFKPDYDGVPDIMRGLTSKVSATTSPLSTGGVFATIAVSLRFELGGFTFAEDLTRGLPDVVFGGHLELPCP
jgi:hypothetical protein